MYDIASRNLPIFDDFSLYYVLCMHVTYKTKNAIQILICDKNRQSIVQSLRVDCGYLLTRKKNGMWGKNRSQSIKSFAFGLMKTDNFQFAMTVYCINNIIRPVVINFMSFAFSYWKASLLSYMLTPWYTRTSACNRETCSGRLKLNHNIHVRIYVICRCSIE